MKNKKDGWNEKDPKKRKPFVFDDVLIASAKKVAKIIEQEEAERRELEIEDFFNK